MGPPLPKIAGDPRRPAEVQHYERPKPKEDEAPDLYLLLALPAGMAALLLKSKVAAWSGVIFILMALANMRTSTVDIKQFLSSSMCALFGLFSLYMAPAMPLASTQPPLVQQQQQQQPEVLQTM